MESLYNEIYKRLESIHEPDYKEKIHHFSKEHLNVIGVRNGAVRKVSAEYFPRVKSMDFPDALETIEYFLAQEIVEMTLLSLDWAFRLRRKFNESNYKDLYRWLDNYVHTWMSCDQLCTEVFGEFIQSYPGYKENLREWAHDPNRWVRRGAAVVLIRGFRKSADDLPYLLEICDILLPDSDDLVQKGYGWALKNAADFDREKVYNYIISRKDTMPRTALRYAIEKMPEEMRKEAMKK